MVTTATLVWIEGEGLRSKMKCLDSKPSKVEDLPQPSFYQADGSNSDVYLKPVKIYACPFYRKRNLLVLCDTYNHNDEPMATNNRKKCVEIMKQAESQHPWFSIKQEHTLLDQDGHPFGWPKNGFPGPQGPYYNGVGANKVSGRKIDMDFVR